MALSDDGTVLFVAYSTAGCVVAYDVATLQLLWTASYSSVDSISYHDGYVLVSAKYAPFTLLSAEDGNVVREFAVAPGYVWSHSVFAGLL